MPRTNVGIPQGQRDIADSLRNQYGGMMNAKSVGQELGLFHHISYEKWLADVPSVNVNGRKKYRVMDVAEKIFINTYSGGVKPDR